MNVIAGTALSHKVEETALLMHSLDATGQGRTAKGASMSLILTAHKSPIAALFLEVEACTGPMGNSNVFILLRIANRTPSLGVNTNTAATADRVLVPGTIIIVIRAAGREVAGQGDERGVDTMMLMVAHLNGETVHVTWSDVHHGNV